jgi:hypothetical protein
MRRQMARRLHQAELEQLRLAHDGLTELAKERKGERGKRQPLIRQDPLAPEKALIDLARAMHVDGMPGSPKPDAFDNIQPDGLPPLYPSDVTTELETHVNYGHLVQANIDRYQSRLRGLRQEIANADKTIAEADAAERRVKWGTLLDLDRLDGRADHPVAAAKRRVALKEMYRDQLKTRPDRIARLKADLEADVADTVKRLEAEYARRDKMRENKPKPDPDKEED